MNLILLVALSCPQTILINHTTEAWNDFDYKTLDSAKVRCGQIYEDAPCVKKFYKRGDQSYWVICGQKEKN